MQYLKKSIAEGKIKTLYTEYGSWWGNNPEEKKEEEIDVVLASKNDILVGECKWQAQKVGSDVVALLKKRAELIRNGRNITYYVFSKSGFKKNCEPCESVTLVTAKDMS